jgi:hypothetical protein
VDEDMTADPTFPDSSGKAVEPGDKIVPRALVVEVVVTEVIDIGSRARVEDRA